MPIKPHTVYFPVHALPPMTFTALSVGMDDL